MALHQDPLHFKTVDSDVAEATLYMVAHLTCCLLPQLVPLALCSPRAIQEGERDHGEHTLPRFGKHEDCAHENESRLKSMNLSHPSDK